MYVRRCGLPASVVAGLLGLVPPAHAQVASSPESTVHHRKVSVAGVEVFYREAGPRDAPVVVLLHGFPSSSFMFRRLIPQLATRYRVIAPDYPGFGHSEFPNARRYRYTFANLATTIGGFLDAVGAQRYSLYVQDYGAPIGFRVALNQPARVDALIVQNGNIYEEGLSPEWNALRDHWRAPTAATRERLRGWLTPDGVRGQYTAGVPRPLLDALDPDTWTLDALRLARPGNVDVQLDLFGDYATNVALYPEFQRFVREAKVPLLIAWGRHDPFFTPAGAEAYLRDAPDAELHWLDTSHFALETHAERIGELMLDFLSRRVPRSAGRAFLPAPRTGS